MTSQCKPSMLEERTQERRMAFRMLQRASHCLRELGEIVRAEIGQVPVFGLRPDLLIGIEFRGIRGQPFDSDPTREPTPELIGTREMNGPAIQDDDDPAGKVFKEFCHEGLEVAGADIMLLEREVQIPMSSPRRDGDHRNPGEAVMTLPTVLEGRVSLRTPRPANHRLEHKARFIEENDGSTAMAGFFLFAASPADATGRWPLRRVRGPGLRGAGNSSRSHAAHARPRKDRSGRQTASRSLRRSASTSTGRSDTRGQQGLSTARAPTLGVARSSAWAGGRDGAWPSSLPVPPVARSSSTGTPPPVRRRVSEPPHSDGDRPRAMRGLGAVDIRELRGFLGFSCMRISNRHADLL